MPVSLWFVSILAFAYSQSCPFPSSIPYPTCYQDTFIIFDNTQWMASDAAVNAQYDFVLNNVLTYFPFSSTKQLSLISYGSGLGTVIFTDFSTAFSKSCGLLYQLRTDSSTYGRQPTTLLETFTVFQEKFGVGPYRVILFTSSRDSNDIAQTYSLIQSFSSPLPTPYSIVVVTPNEGFFDEWKNPVYVTDVTISYPPTGLAKCILYCESWQSESAFAVTEQHGKASYTPCPAVTNCTNGGLPVNCLCPSGSYVPDNTDECCLIQSTPTPSKNPFASFNCSCEYGKIWNDIIYIIETSASMSKPGLAASVSTMKSNANYMNIQQSGYTASPYYARVGVIGYGSTATVIAPLGSVDNNQFQAVQVPYTGDHDAATNLESAIRMAIAQFQTNGRSTSKPVIHIYAATYSSAGVNSPNVIADQFKEYGVIIVYDYVESNGAPDLTLQQIASPGYFIDSRYADSYASLQAFCDANCFCGANEQFIPYIPRKAPQGGCYFDMSNVPSNYQLASQACVGLDASGVVAMDYSATISTFINSFAINTQLWNGLTWQNGQYVWADGTPFSATSSSYSPWSPSTPPPAGKECTMMARSSGSTMKWFQQQCSSILPYICQLAPCDSTRWCDRLNAN